MSLRTELDRKKTEKMNYTKNATFFFIFFISIMNYAQNIDIESKITFIDGKEINSKIRFRKSFFYENEIYENSITQKKITLINENGKKEKHIFEEFKKIEFTDLKGKTRIFERPIDKFGLFELMYGGLKLKWYRDYTENMYDHSQSSYDILINDKGEYQMFGILTNNRKKLTEITSDKPELKSIIEKCNFDRKADECFREVVEKYNQ